MGDPRRIKNKYSRPMILWDKERIKTDKGLKKEYGLKNTRELWIAQSELRKIRREARRLLSLSEEERKKDVEKIIKKLLRLGIISEQINLEDILTLSVRDILERRLQTRVVKKGLARTIKQARQLITHGFIAINGKRITSPGYLVTATDDPKIEYYKYIDTSPPKPKVVEEAKEEKEEEKKADEEKK